jgi:hypothetical protein
MKEVGELYHGPSSPSHHDHQWCSSCILFLLNKSLLTSFCTCCCFVFSKDWMNEWLFLFLFNFMRNKLWGWSRCKHMLVCMLWGPKLVTFITIFFSHPKFCTFFKSLNAFLVVYPLLELIFWISCHKF